MQLLDDRVMLGHATHAERKHHRQNRGKPFRHGRDGQRNGQKQRIDHIMDVVETFGQRQRHQHHDRDDAHRDAEDLGDVVHFLLQRTVVVIRGLQQIRDLADLRAHAGAGHDGAAGALRHGRAVEHHVGPVAQSLGFGERIDVLADRHAFAGEARLGHAQACGGKQTAVGGHGIAFAEHDHVSRHHVHGVDARDGAVAQHVGLRRGHLGERLDGFLRFRFLDVAEHRVDDEDEHDDDGVERQCFTAFRARHGIGPLNEPCDERDAGGGEQQIDEGIFELCQEFLPFRHRWGGREFVRTVLSEPALRLRLTQAGVRIDAEGCGHRLRAGERWIELGRLRAVLLPHVIADSGIFVGTGMGLDGLIFLAINHGDLLGSAAE